MHRLGLGVFFVLGVVAGGLWWLLQATPAPVRPNVLLISLDTLRPDHLGCYGYSKNTSPHLDRFAEKCLRFTSCRTQAPWTLPAHMALFTSLPPAENGVDNINKVLPPELPTLAELLRGAGYRTAALVNNAQMRAHWGFARGFDLWREFEADTPAGNCENITAQALAWLAEQKAKDPFFLFLHYYDPHEPYDAPEEFRRQFGAALSGPETRRLAHAHRRPGQDFDDPKQLEQLIAAYDAEIAWLDSELGKLLAAVPPNTLVVLFSDHGEAFKEHGWLLHGATLFEEEIRTVLLMHLPDAAVKPTALDESVMLLDVAPTILARCGVAPPGLFQGRDLSPLWQRKTWSPRLVPVESKAVLEGQYSIAVVLYPLKGIYSPLDGRFDAYRLPDERTPLGDKENAATAALLEPLRRWMNEEPYWMIHASGGGDFEAEVSAEMGTFAVYIPVGLDPLRDSFEAIDDGRVLRWHVYPGGPGRAKSLLLQLSPADAGLHLDFKLNGARQKGSVFLGKDGAHPPSLPATVSANLSPVEPFVDKPFTADRPGLYAFRHRSAQSRLGTGRVQPLGEQTIRQLRSLGYLQ